MQSTRTWDRRACVPEQKGTLRRAGCEREHRSGQGSPWRPTATTPWRPATGLAAQNPLLQEEPPGCGPSSLLPLPAQATEQRHQTGRAGGKEAIFSSVARA